jgi:hypothetical protein
LSYRKNMEITEDEYKTLLDSPSNMKMVNGKNISIKVTRDKDKITLKASGTTSFDEMTFNLMNRIEQLKAKAM